MIDFEIPDDLAALRDEIRAFVVDKIVPYERDPRLTRHGPDEDLRNRIGGAGRDAGLLTFQAPRQFGGREPSHREQAVLFEAAGWSTLGPVALNCAAPTRATCSCWARSPTTSRWNASWCRSSTAAALGVRDDRTRRRRFGPGPVGHRGGVRRQRKYVINGRKWLITGADGARTWIIMARLAPNPHGADGPTLFLCDGQTPGFTSSG